MDKKIVYEWANDPETRRSSFQQEKIAWETHESWYGSVMDSMKAQEADGTVLYICMDFMQPVGNVRIRKDGKGSAEISYAVSPEYRGLGYGKKMLELLEKELGRKDAQIRELTAEVKQSNPASAHIFESLGYRKDLDGEVLKFCKELKPLGEKSDGKLRNKERSAGKLPSESSRSRQPSFELLRVLAMCMVITLHYLGKGGLLDKNLAEDGSLVNWGCWTLEALCLAAVNVYVLISGYFLVGQQFRLGKFVRLWCQVLFYSIGVALVLMASGVVDYRAYMDLFQIQFFLLPTVNGHYWFASAYLLMYLFAPFLAAGMQKMNRKQHGTLILLLLTFFCFAKSVLPFELPFDDKGNGCLWFLCLFVIAGYFRLYGMPFLQKKGRGILVYFLSVCAILLSFGLAASLYQQTGKYETFLSVPLAYNFVFVLTASLGLFAAFAGWKVRETALTRFLVRLAPYTFGVYLLHEHLLLRYQWTKWLGVSKSYGWMRPLHLLAAVLIVFTVGVAVDAVRTVLFRAAENLIIWALKMYYSRREVWDYLIFGALATLVNWIAYLFCAYFALIPLLGNGSDANKLVSNAVAWIVSVLFAYWTNRSFVFHSEVTGGAALWKEFLSFVGARVFSFLVEQAMFFVMVTMIALNDLVSKLIIGIVVILLNYIFSKLWIFKGKKR